jgi:hypothetical protein
MLVNLEALFWLLPSISTLLVSAGLSCEMTDLLAAAESQVVSATGNPSLIHMDPAQAQLLRPDQNSPCTLVQVACASSWSGGLALGTLRIAANCSGCDDGFPNPSTPAPGSREENAASSSVPERRLRRLRCTSPRHECGGAGDQVKTWMPPTIGSRPFTYHVVKWRAGRDRPGRIKPRQRGYYVRTRL